MNRIDVHTHYLPQEYRDRLDELDTPIRIDTEGDQGTIHHSHGTIPLAPGFTDVSARREWMSDHGVDTTLVSVSTPNPLEGPFSVAESTRLAKAINDGFARLQREYPDEIGGLGTLPLRDPEAAVHELDRIASDLDLVGVALPTAVRGRKLSHPSLEPVFDRLDELGLSAFMHPRPNATSENLEDDEWYATPLAIFPSETTIQLTRLIFDGFFDRHDFDLVVAHLGGTLPYLAGRIERGRELFADPDGPPARPIGDYLEELYYDVISFHPPAMRAAFETVGTDHFVFGTDYPFGVEDAAATVDSLEAALPEGVDPATVNRTTAADLFDL